MGFFLVHSYAHVGLYQFSTVIYCRLARTQKYCYAKVTTKIAIVPRQNLHSTSLLFFSVKQIRNHGCCSPPPLPLPVALGHPLKQNVPGRHITGNARCAFFGEIQERGGGMHKFLMLVNTIIYFRILSPPPNSIVPITIKLRSPCTPHRSRVLSYPSPVAPTCF